MPHEDLSMKLKGRIIIFDASKVPDFDTYNKLLREGKISECIIGEEEFTI